MEMQKEMKGLEQRNKANFSVLCKESCGFCLILAVPNDHLGII